MILLKKNVINNIKYHTKSFKKNPEETKLLGELSDDVLIFLTDCSDSLILAFDLLLVRFDIVYISSFFLF